MSDAPRPEDSHPETDPAAEAGQADVPGSEPDAPADAPDAVVTGEAEAAIASDVPDADTAEERDPTEEELASAVPAVVRRAPRFARMIATGAVPLFFIGFLLGALLPNAENAGRFLSGLLIGLGFGTIGAVIAGAIATRADAVASRRADETRARTLEWLDNEEGR